MKRIFLVGYMGAGKTTLGRLIAQLMEMEFIDLDHYIERRYMKSVNEIFKEKGEEFFRQFERNMLHEVGTFENVVVSTGGGAPCFFDNARFMNEHGISVYLKTNVETLFSRLKTGRHTRPILKDKNDEELLDFISGSIQKREPYYQQATLIFDASHLDSVEQINEAANTLQNLLLQYK